MQTLKCLCRKKEFWKTIIIRNNPLPFPGKYPTRWNCVIRDAKKKVLFRYRGKPSVYVMKQIIAKTKRISGSIGLSEFDRGGVIRRADCWLPVDYLAISNWSPAICNFYYPFHVSNEVFFSAWSGKIGHKQLTMGRRTWFIYGPTDSILKEPWLEGLRQYRIGLKNLKLVKPPRNAKPASQKITDRPFEFVRLEGLPPRQKVVLNPIQFNPHYNPFNNI